MKINDNNYTAIWCEEDTGNVFIIDQTKLPHQFEILELVTLEDFCIAIRDMQVRGAPLIGATAAYGFALALQSDASSENIQKVAEQLIATRPTAVDLSWAVKRIQKTISELPQHEKAEVALVEAHKIRQGMIDMCEAIGENGLQLIKECYEKKGDVVNILTHCNAGWLAAVDWGTAIAPMHKAYFADIPIHVWVDETRPRNQGASLTAYELAQQGIAHTVIADNAGGHLMQHGKVDMCIVGSDRTTSTGDVCNKIGTYLKALAAHDNGVPFYVTLPSSTIDWQLTDGVNQIPIEQRDVREMTHMAGLDVNRKITEIQLFENSPAANYAFDVTPSRLVTKIITEHGIHEASEDGLKVARR